MVIRGDGRVLRLFGSPRVLLRSSRNDGLRTVAARVSRLVPIEYHAFGGRVNVTVVDGEATLRVGGVRVARRSLIRRARGRAA